VSVDDYLAETHTTARLETFCDGVFAIALTLLVLDLKVPSADLIRTTPDVWLALRHMAPSISAFVLSFTIILITWVNHDAVFRLVNKASTPFIYANGFLLLSVVFMPFSTALVGEHLLTDHAAPAVVIYDAVTAVQAIGWILVCGTALRNRQTKDVKSAALLRENQRNGYVALAIYSLLALAAFWLPLTIAIVTTALWAYWLAFSLRSRIVRDEMTSH